MKRKIFIIFILILFLILITGCLRNAPFVNKTNEKKVEGNLTTTNKLEDIKLGDNNWILKDQVFKNF